MLTVFAFGQNRYLIVSQASMGRVAKALQRRLRGVSATGTMLGAGPQRAAAVRAFGHRLRSAHGPPALRAENGIVGQRASAMGTGQPGQLDRSGRGQG